MFLKDLTRIPLNERVREIKQGLIKRNLLRKRHEGHTAQTSQISKVNWLKEWRKQEDKNACSSSTSTVARPVGDSTRAVPTTRLGLTAQIRGQDNRNREASSHTEELVISTISQSSWKRLRQQTSFIKYVRRSRNAGTLRQRNRTSRRPDAEFLDGAAKYLKAQAFNDHLPSIVDAWFDPSDERNALKQAGRWLFGKPMELDQLVALVIIQKLFSQAENTDHQRKMQELCKFLQEPNRDKFILEPCNSGGVLQWMALFFVAASFQAPKDAGLQEAQPNVRQKVFPEAFDSHFRFSKLMVLWMIFSSSTSRWEPENLSGRSSCHLLRTFLSKSYLDYMFKHISNFIQSRPKRVARINADVQKLLRLLG